MDKKPGLVFSLRCLGLVAHLLHVMMVVAMMVTVMMVVTMVMMLCH
ncbi:hypothetical protein LB524_27565 [Mesorhizobium sp. ESP6-5]|nr:MULTISPECIES: hypothetical protein [Mesorhizobium]MBZ9759051.1 hypothetical protein [Mesorhizobium sp. ESP6-5]MBZ9904839.1 hypothetical protein [Mesorhizobium sp. BR115XR7A]MBZ9930323.1 hypothetical protein [Mesorhizobium sp. BR1-1-5]MBZ9974634.1 hypothetical protein [Mesorhizobium sp. BR-1-1-10]